MDFTIKLSRDAEARCHYKDYHSNIGGIENVQESRSQNGKND